MIIVIISAAITYVLLLPNSPSAKSQTPENSQQQASENTPDAAQSKAGIYTDYSDEATLANTNDVTLLFFHAPWCTQCRAIEKSIETDGVPDGVAVFKVDYDSHQQLRQKYGVTLQTTFVKIDKNGTKIKSYVAYEEPNFSSVKRELLP